MSEPTFRTVQPPADAEPTSGGSPVATMEGIGQKLLAEARAERRILLARVEANSRLVAKLEAALAGLGVTETE